MKWNTTVYSELQLRHLLLCGMFLNGQPWIYIQSLGLFKLFYARFVPLRFSLLIDGGIDIFWEIIQKKREPGKLEYKKWWLLHSGDKIFVVVVVPIKFWFNILKNSNFQLIKIEWISHWDNRIYYE